MQGDPGWNGERHDIDHQEGLQLVNVLLVKHTLPAYAQNIRNQGSDIPVRVLEAAGEICQVFRGFVELHSEQPSLQRLVVSLQSHVAGEQGCAAWGACLLVLGDRVGIMHRLQSLLPVVCCVLVSQLGSKIVHDERDPTRRVQCAQKAGNSRTAATELGKHPLRRLEPPTGGGLAVVGCSRQQEGHRETTVHLLPLGVQHPCPDHPLCAQDGRTIHRAKECHHHLEVLLEHKPPPPLARISVSVVPPVVVNASESGESSRRHAGIGVLEKQTCLKHVPCLLQGSHTAVLVPFARVDHVVLCDK